MSCSLAVNSGSVDSLNWRTRCGCRPWWRQDTLHRGNADPGGLSHGRPGPVGGFAGRVVSGQGNDPLDHLCRQWRHARRPGLVAQQPVHPGGHEPLLPAPHACLALPGAAHDLDRAETVGGQQNDRGAPDVFLRAVTVGRHRFKANAVGAGGVYHDIFAHAPDSHPPRARGILFRILPSGFIH
jgi:hypothetical protein